LVEKDKIKIKKLNRKFGWAFCCYSFWVFSSMISEM
jgi:hypothetical protein